MGKKNINNDRNDIFYTAVQSGKEKQEIFQEELGPVPRIGKRHWQCFWLFWLVFIAYGTRVVITVAIVAMTDPLASINPDVPTYPHWTQKGAILSAFFWGYICPQVFAGYAANRFGGKWFLISAMGIQSLLGILSPFAAANLGPIVFMITRAVQGLCQGFFFPTVTHILGQWVPKEERSRLANATFAAVPIGTVTSILTTGLIAASSYGWPMTFYVYGAAGFIWCICFTIVGHDSPADHPSISKAEKYYIENSLGHTDEKPSHRVPWVAIFTSKPVWALLIAQCAWVLGFWTLLNQIPTYMKHVMNFNIKENSVLSSLPYLTLFFFGISLSFVSDFIINKKFLSQTVSRKVFNTIGNVFPAAALILLAYTKHDEPNKAVALLIVAVAFTAASNFGWSINHLDLTPNHAGMLMGICNAVSNILAIWAPLMVQILVKNEKDPVEWRIVFFITAAVYVASAIIFIIFGSGKAQSWNEDQDEDKEKTNKL